MEQQLRDQIAEFTSVIRVKDAEIQRLQNEISTVDVQLKGLRVLVEKNNDLSLKNLTMVKKIQALYEKNPAIMKVLQELMKPEEVTKGSLTLEESIKSDYQ